LLTAFAGLLVHDDPMPDKGFVVILGGDRRYDVAAEWIKDDTVQGVIVFRQRPTALSACGIIPPAHEIADRELQARSVNSTQISVIKSEGRLLWDAADRLGHWLGEHDDDLIVLTSQFGSERVRYIVDQTIPAELAARIHIVPLVDRRFNQQNWWKKRIGFRMCFSLCVRSVYARIARRPDPGDLFEWDPDAFERELSQLVAVEAGA